MNGIYKDKKILILGGSYQHRKLVSKAKEMGMITYVTDYLHIDDSPAKQMADFRYMYDINDIDALEKLCRDEHIDGVIAPYLDVTQRPYQKLCERMGWPCFGNAFQHEILIDKRTFKEFCVNHGADIIPSYTEEDICMRKSVEFPILVKPCDSRGSRGQTICNTYEEVLNAVEYAKSESISGDVIIEKYMGNSNDIQLVYFVIEGEPILQRVEDRYLGQKGTGLETLCIASVIESLHNKVYREKADKKVASMIKDIGLVNSPVFLQAFMDGEVARLYDPGIRLPGDDYDLAYKAATGIDISELLLEFAITGKMSTETGKLIEKADFNRATAMIFPGVRPGKIKKIVGLTEIVNHPSVLEYTCAYKEGDVVGVYNNVKQRFGEFILETENFEKMKELVDWIWNTLKVFNENGEDMLFAKFDTDELKKYYQ